MFSLLTSYLPPLSSLPLPSLPQNLQPRLLSFLLRRAVGRFVKGELNTSTDGEQVKADLSQGTISVSNLELDPNAITPLLDGLPIEFVSGEVGLVQAQVDWPLSFSSGVQLSVDTININLKLKSQSSHSPKLSRSPSNPVVDDDASRTDPISAAASEFVHDELDAFEDAELRASLVMDASTSDVGASFRLPGAFGGAAFTPTGGDESPQDAGQEVTLLASLLAGLLARLKVEVTRVRVRLLLPAGEDGEGEAEVELVIDSAKYADEVAATGAADVGARSKTVRISPPQVRLRLSTPPPRPSTPHSNSDGDSRSTRRPSPASSRHSSDSIPSIPSIPDLSASAVSLPPPPPPPPAAAPPSQPSPPRRYDSDSSDESDVGPEHDMMMSQSIADMRSSFVSARSGGESMYASALGGTMAASRMEAIGEGESEEDDSPFVDPQTRSPSPPAVESATPSPEPEIAAEAEVSAASPAVPANDGFRLILSFGHDELAMVLSPKEPAQLAPPQLSPPFAHAGSQEAPTLSSSSPSRTNSPIVRPSSLHPDPFASSPDDSPTLSPSADAVPPPPQPAGRRAGPAALHVTATLGGPISLLLLPAQLGALVRIGAAFATRPSAGPSSTPARSASRTATTSSGVGMSVSLKAVHVVVGLSPAAELFSPEEVGAFFAHPATHPVPSAHLRARFEGVGVAARPGGELEATLRAYSITEALSDGATRPVMVSDVNVARQYDLEEAFPTFDAADWVGDKAFEARGWRTRPGHVGRRRATKEADRPAVTIELSLSKRDVSLGPVHVFADLTVLHRLQPLIDYLAPLAATFQPPPPQPSSPTVTRPRTPRPLVHGLGDLPRASTPINKPLQELSAPLHARCELVRVSVRVPSPAGQRTPIRSGILKVDVHALAFHGDVNGQRVDMQRAGVFFLPAQASQAVGFLSLTPLARLPHSLPSIRLPSPTSPTTAIELPLLRVRLTKPVLDGLQLFADDLGQWSAARAGGSPSSSEIERGSRGGDAKILGSAYFGASRQRGGSESSDDLSRSGSQTGGKKVEVKLSELMVDLLVEEKAKADVGAGARAVRRMRARGTDLTVQAHLGAKQEGDMSVELELGDVGFEDATDGRPVQRFLERTAPALASPTPPPIVALAFSGSVDQETGLKESRIQLTLAGFTYFLTSDLAWLQDLATFAKAPEGAFETVVPNELTKVRLRLVDASVHVTPPNLESRMVVSIDEAKLATNLMPDLPRTRTFVEVVGLHALAIDSAADLVERQMGDKGSGAGHWKGRGYVQLAVLEKAALEIRQGNGQVLPDLELEVLESKLSLSLCADSIASVAALFADLTPPKPASAAKAGEAARPARRVPIERSSADLLASLDGAAFAQARAMPEAPEDLDDDVPTNLDYLAEALQQGSTPSAAASAGRKAQGDRPGVVISEIEGETIRMLDPKGIAILDDFLAEPRVDAAQEAEQNPVSVTRCRLSRCDVTIHIHEGYDWATTRSAIAAEAKAVRRRLEKIKQLLADGQTPDASAEQASVLLFNSVTLGLPPGASELPGPQLLAAIEDELDRDEGEGETVVGTEVGTDIGTEVGDDATSMAESWQTLPAKAKPTPGPSRATASGKRSSASGKARRRLTRARSSAIEVVLKGIAASFDAFPPESQRSARLKVAVSTFEILDHVRTSTWRKFLTELRASDGGVVRASGAPMVRLELDQVWPAHRTADAQEELVIKLKIFPLRLYIDQDALDFLKAFSAFKVPPAADAPGPASPSGVAPAAAAAAAPSQELFFQRVEILPVKIKLDYKPKRVDYHALRKGRTAELMNFFHFDGSEITLRHLVVTGISGAVRLSELVNDIWTPDVTSHQLADVLSGIAPVKSVVNVGSGMANLVLLPIEQYRKDGRVVRGLQKGAQAFARQTTMEALSVGARLATGTQGLLEQAEGLLGGRPGSSPASAAAGPSTSSASPLDAISLEDSVELSEAERRELVSRYASQPASLRGGLEEAYKSLGSNLKEAAQTILAVPMEVYERSGPGQGGPVRAVVRAVPVAVLRPMIGGAGAVGKALLGLRNELDPEGRVEAEGKYKTRGGE